MWLLHGMLIREKNMKYLYDEKVEKKISQIGLGGGKIGSTFSDDISLCYLILLKKMVVR